MSQLRFDDWDDAPLAASASLNTPATPAATPAQSQSSTPLPAQASGAPISAAPQAQAAPSLPLRAGAALAPINPEDKRVVNGKADINQLAPFKYPWAWEFFLNANRNHWTPLEISMAQDVHDYHHKLSPAERHVFENVLAYLTTSDILAMRNIGLAVMEKMSAPELQIYQARQVYEEALHTWTYQHCIESLGLNQQEIYNRYRVVPEIHGKIALANRRLERVMRSDFDLTDRDNLHEFALSYLFFAGIFEGCWFYNGFTPIFALQRRGLMKGTAEQLQYIMRDEVLHCAFGIRVVRQLLQEENLTLDPAAVKALWEEAEAAEAAYAGYILREPILGYNADLHRGQFRFIANRRARQLGLAEPFPGAENVLPWLDEQANMRKEKNFFETRVTEYQTGGALAWD
ncbi:ribonucleoside-diphosphate reductase subunit beta [Azospira sp. I13]|uniref:ribonucleotide-diphosphate reductase subunit beta n=1 Tax=Azospira sp. I13 TaxID=1765050 RepID=UPI000D44B400|nr:ribonucleotide-diphosphate reductase subunit beta [Azospira sp. I13]GBG02599.1 ribonucleoside-diphosphate reductase subunit beta [Azospira sp. I13]